MYYYIDGSISVILYQYLFVAFMSHLYILSIIYVNHLCILSWLFAKINSAVIH